jgi:hypothetical protein
VLVADVRDPGRLGEIADCIHDRYFELDGIEHDAEDRILTIPYPRERPELARVESTGLVLERVHVPMVRWFLRVHRVRDYSIRDTERVGQYDFDGLAYDATGRRITVKTNIPLGFTVDVDALHVTVETSDEVLETRIRRRIRRRRGVDEPPAE